MAPEILQYEGALVERAKEQIELVIEKFMFHNLKSEEAERRLSEQEKVLLQVPQPHLDTFVVCRSKNFFSLNLYEEEESPETVETDHGDLYFIRYKIVKGPN